MSAPFAANCIFCCSIYPGVVARKLESELETLSAEAIVLRRYSVDAFFSPRELPEASLRLTGQMLRQLSSVIGVTDRILRLFGVAARDRLFRRAAFKRPADESPSGLPAPWTEICGVRGPIYWMGPAPLRLIDRLATFRRNLLFFCNAVDLSKYALKNRIWDINRALTLVRAAVEQLGEVRAPPSDEDQREAARLADERAVAIGNLDAVRTEILRLYLTTL